MYFLGADRLELVFVIANVGFVESGVVGGEKDLDARQPSLEGIHRYFLTSGFASRTMTEMCIADVGGELLGGDFFLGAATGSGSAVGTAAGSG